MADMHQGSSVGALLLELGRQVGDCLITMVFLVLPVVPLFMHDVSASPAVPNLLTMLLQVYCCGTRHCVVGYASKVAIQYINSTAVLFALIVDLPVFASVGGALLAACAAYKFEAGLPLSCCV
jgi:hypothetical protein